MSSLALLSWKIGHQDSLMNGCRDDMPYSFKGVCHKQEETRFILKRGGNCVLSVKVRELHLFGNMYIL